MVYDIDNLRFVFFTHQHNIHLVELALKYFFEFNTLENIKISVISNTYSDYSTLPFQDKVEYLSGNVEFCSSGTHFSETLKQTLPHIKEDYIFTFCDDYFFIANTEFDKLKKVMSLIVKEDIQYFSFADHSQQEIKSNWKPFIQANSTFPDDQFYFINNDYRYLYSVQPAIWKKNSLYELASTYNFSLHQLDETLPVMKSQNKFKCIAKSYNLVSNFSHLVSLSKNYFTIAYCEIVRHGIFFHPTNGFGLGPNELGVKLINKLIEEADLIHNSAFKGLLYKW